MPRLPGRRSCGGRDAGQARDRHGGLAGQCSAGSWRHRPGTGRTSALLTSRHNPIFLIQRRTTCCVRSPPLSSCCSPSEQPHTQPNAAMAGLAAKRRAPAATNNDDGRPPLEWGGRFLARSRREPCSKGSESVTFANLPRQFVLEFLRQPLDPEKLLQELRQHLVDIFSGPMLAQFAAVEAAGAVSAPVSPRPRACCSIACFVSCILQRLEVWQ